MKPANSNLAGSRRLRAKFEVAGCQPGFAKAHHQISLEEKWMWPWGKKAPRN